MSAIASLSPSHRPVVGSPLTSSVTSDTQTPVLDSNASSFERSAAGPSPAQRPTDGLTPPSSNVGPLNPTPSQTTAALMAKITSATKDWEFNFYGNEGGAGFSAVHIPGNAGKLDSFQDFKEAVIKAGVEKFGLTTEMLQSSGAFDPVNEHFIPQLLEHIAEDPADYPKAKEFISILNKDLVDAKVVIVGAEYTIESLEHPCFIVGVAPDGALVGIHTLVVWT